jgi:phosphoenolpyruvate---glycerone phosphotransferase subunit DhaL
MKMVLTKKDFLNMLKGASDALDEKIDEFSDIDSKFGDGDHGVTVSKISKAIKAKVESTPDDETLTEMFESLGKDIMNVNGGSAGPLYGTIVAGFGEGLEGIEQADEAAIKSMFAGSLEGMGFISTAKVGDKTLMDTLIPACEKAASSDAKLPQLLEEITQAAYEGAEYSKQCQAKFGRARFHKEATIGTMDAGAYSLYCLIKGLCSVITK